MKIKMLHLKTKTGTGILPARLVFWAEQSSNAGGDQGAFELQKDWQKFPNLAAMGTHLEAAQQQGLITEEEKAALLQQAQPEFAERERAEAKRTDLSELRKKIDEAKRKEKPKAIKKEVQQRLERGEFESFAELRQFVRSEIEALGIPFRTQPPQYLREFIQFEAEVLTNLKEILQLNEKYRRIYAEAEQEQQSAAKCWQKFWDLYENKRDFLAFLENQGIPEELRGTVEKVLKSCQEIPNYRDLTTFAGLVDPFEIIRLQDSLEIVENLEKAWRETTGQTTLELKSGLEKYQEKLESYRAEVEALSTGSANKQLFENELAAIRSNAAEGKRLLAELQKGDPKAGKEGLATTLKSTKRRLIESFLRSQAANLKERRADLKELIRANEIAEAASEAEPGHEKGTAQEYREPHGHHHEEGGGFFADFNKMLGKFFTAGDRIRWYSIYDIIETFKLLKNSFDKHQVSISEDKRAPLAKGLVFWRPEIERRIHHIDISEEKSRAEDLKKTYENYDRERLVAELKDDPPKDRTRAILETLAQRGNLLMSDREIIDIICPGDFSEEDWRQAIEDSNFDIMQHFFKTRIEERLHEVGYGQNLIDKQTSGYGSAVENGKKLVAAGQTLSTQSEFGIFTRQTAASTLEGEGKVFGMVETAIGRANVFSGNKSGEVIASININGKAEKVTQEANVGLYGLRLVDALLKGEIHQETLNDISKRNESGFNPFSSFADLAVKKEGQRNGRKVTIFEEWGWISTTGTPTITELGKTELIKFYNTRNAKIRREDGKEKLVHLAIDSGTYKRHSRRHSSVHNALNSGIKVGDKLASYLVKNSSLDLFYSASRQHKNRPGETVAEIEELASLLKAGVEDFQDGAEMVKDGDRYYDSYDEKECTKEGKKIADGSPVKGQVISYGYDRLERGKNILTKIMDNLAEETRDTKPVILQVSGQYEGLSLIDFLQKKLAPYKNEYQFEYALIMASLRNLAGKGAGNRAAVA